MWTVGFGRLSAFVGMVRGAMVRSVRGLPDALRDLTGCPGQEAQDGKGGKHARQLAGAKGGLDALIGKRLQAGNDRAGIEIRHGSGEHPNLTDPPECPCSDRRQSHERIDRKKRDRRNQSHGKQIIRAVTLEGCVDPLQAIPESVLDRVTKEKAADEKRKRRAGRGCKTYQKGSSCESKVPSTEQAQHHGSRKEAGDGGVDDKCAGIDQ